MIREPLTATVVPSAPSVDDDAADAEVVGSGAAPGDLTLLGPIAESFNHNSEDL